MAMNKKLFLILTLALILRLINLNQSLWLDEAIQVMAVYENSLKDLFLNYFPGDFNPPLSYLISWVAVRIFGLSEISLRFPSVIFGVLNVWLVYLFANKTLRCSLKSTPGVDFSRYLRYFPEFAALLLAISPLHIYYSQESRPYILACLLTTWSMYEFWRSLIPGVDPAKKTPGVDKETPGVNLNWRYILSTTLMLYSHYMAWLLIPTQLLIFLIKNKSEIRISKFETIFKFEFSKFKNLLTSWFFIGLLLIPWLPTFLKQLEASRGVARALPLWRNLGIFSFKNLSLIPVKFLIGRISIDNNLIYALVMLPTILLVGWLLVRVLKEVFSPQSPVPSPQLAISYLSLWFFFPLALGIILSFRLPILQYFRFFFVLPAFYMLLVYGILRIRPFKILILFFLIFNLTCSSIYLFNPKFHREDWEGTVNFISKKNLNAPIVILKPASAPFHYYAGLACKSDQAWPALVDYQETEKVRYLPKIWLIKYGQPIFDPENKTEKKLKDFGFEEVSEHYFRGIIVKYLVNPSGLKASSFKLLATSY